MLVRMKPRYQMVVETNGKYKVIYGILDQFLEETNIELDEFENMILQIVIALW